MEEPMEIARQKMEHLRQLLENPVRNKAAVLRIFYDLFQLTHEGRDLHYDTVEWLNKTAFRFLSPKLWDVLEKHSLEVYSFQLAALNLTDVEDVIDDLSNGGEILKSIRSFPAGAYNKLKREFFGSHQLHSLKQLMMDPQFERQFKNFNFSSGDYDQSAIFLPPNIFKPQSFAEKFLPHCRLVGKNSSGKELYKLPLTKKENRNQSSKTDRWMFDSPKITKFIGNKKRTILLMGATGSGKTTLINAMVNHILGVEFKDPFRFLLIDEESSSSLPYSQTSKVNVYELYRQEGFKVPFHLTIVDTPGYGDIKGIERYHPITDSIQQFFKNGEINELSAVGITLQASATHSTRQKYIFESILAIFGNNVRDNIRFLVTFSDGPAPPALEAIKEANIVHQLDARGQPHHHRFNNSGFFTSNQMDVAKADSNPKIWDLNIQHFKSFFASLPSQATLLALTKDVLEERKKINDDIIEELMLDIERELIKIEELRKTKQIIENYKDEIEGNSDFKFDFKVSKGYKIYFYDDEFTTNCSTCLMACAESADIDQLRTAMDSNGFCTSCPKKCKWDDHTIQPFQWVLKDDVTFSCSYKDIKNKYEKALQKNLSTEGVLQALESEFKQMQDDLDDGIDVCQYDFHRLDEIALHPNVLTSVSHFELMIQTEEKEKRAGFQERIESFNSLLNKAKLVQDLRLRAKKYYFPRKAVRESRSFMDDSSQVIRVI